MTFKEQILSDSSYPKHPKDLKEKAEKFGVVKEVNEDNVKYNILTLKFSYLDDYYGFHLEKDEEKKRLSNMEYFFYFDKKDHLIVGARRTENK